MFRVIAVDDETIVRIAIQNIIDWEQYGMVFVGAAADGHSALKIVAEKAPDIIITDLVMKDMDGSELIKKLMEVHYKGKIIVLSNYSEFEMVKETLKFGAFDYILKNSLNGANLLEVLENAKKALMEERENTTNARMVVPESMIQYQEANISRELRRAILGDKYDDDLLTKNYPMEQHYCLIYLKSGIDSNLIKNPRYKHIDNIVEEVLGSELFFNTIYEKNQNYIVLCSSKVLEHPYLFNKVIASIKIYTNCNFIAGISHDFNTITDIKNYFDELKERMKYIFYMENISVYNINSYSETDEIIFGKELRIDMNKIMESIINGQDKLLERDLLNSISKYCKDTWLDPDLLKKWIEVTVIQIISQYDIKNKEVHNDFEILMIQLQNAIYLNSTMEVLWDILMKIKNYNENKKKSKEVNEVVEYINAHYQKKLSLNSLATYVNLSPSYLAKIFKREMGVTVIDYVNEYKIKKAAAILKAANVLVKEAAYKVGIEDQFYFSKLFKKYMGENPSKYYEKIHKRPDSNEKL